MKKYLFALCSFMLLYNVNAQTTFWIDVPDTVEVISYCSCDKEKSKPQFFYDWFKIKLKKEELLIEIKQEYPSNSIFLQLNNVDHKDKYIYITENGEWYISDKSAYVDEFDYIPP